MALDPDPYRTLGLKRGATLDDVKRAYRRLAKINHPDAAGEAALPRFLAIQAAYEQLAGPAPGTGRRPTPAPRRPWDAEADKTRRAYGGRARNAPPGGAGTGGAGATGKGGAAGADGATGGSAAPGEGSGGWTRRTGSAGRTGGASARPGRRRTYEPRPDSGTPGTPPPGGKTRAPNKATLGSTSYDGADVGPFEPDWGGANWYGTTSGTYWTVNPKEYADPRKHGPEYQARARRAARARGADPSMAGPDAEAPPDAARRSRRAGRPGDGRPPGRPDPHDVVLVGLDGGTGGPRGSGRRPGHGRRSVRRLGGRPTGDASGRGPAHTSDEPRTDEPPPDLGRAAADITHALTDDRFGGSRGRLARAFIGWLPIALGLSWLVGEMTGCGRFAATCDDGVAGPMLFVLQILAFAVLLVIPAAGSIATMAALTLLAAAVVASLVLSATGGAADGDSRRAALGLILLLAWLDRSGHRRRPPSPHLRVTSKSRILTSMPRRHDQRDLSAAAQQYLLTLRVLVGPDDSSRVTAAQIARHIGVTTQAASEMFRRLVADGLVAHAEGRDLHLTPAGRTAADGIFRRHALLEWLLTSVIGLGWAESDDEAMRLQGAISPRVEARLDEMLGHPETCPHGNPIDAETARRRPAGIRLSEMEAGSPATIYRITEEAEEDAGLLSYLEARALTPGAQITILARSESLDSLTLDGPRGRATLGLRPAALVRVLPGEADPALFHRVPAQAAQR